jgi:capsular polysaccharide biosynthesis protein
MQRSVVSRVESRASQTNVAVLNPAVVPWAPDRPRLALNVLLSVAIGVLLGLSAVVLMEILDRRVRSATDLRDGWNVPLLGVLEGRR